MNFFAKSSNEGFLDLRAIVIAHLEKHERYCFVGMCPLTLLLIGMFNVF